MPAGGIIFSGEIEVILLAIYSTLKEGKAAIFEKYSGREIHLLKAWSEVVLSACCVSFSFGFAFKWIHSLREEDKNNIFQGRTGLLLFNKSFFSSGGRFHLCRAPRCPEEAIVLHPDVYIVDKCVLCFDVREKWCYSSLEINLDAAGYNKFFHSWQCIVLKWVTFSMERILLSLCCKIKWLTWISLITICTLVKKLYVFNYIRKYNEKNYI